MSEYKGIDYGLGRSNIDKATGIRYGVISQHTVGQAWYDSSEPYYGKPELECEKCGVLMKETLIGAYKTVEYSYPTSESATQFGFGKTGCYTVYTCSDPCDKTLSRFTPNKAVTAFIARADAVQYARSMALPWLPLHLNYHPEDAA